jgi:hypothetical protein
MSNDAENRLAQQVPRPDADQHFNRRNILLGGT